MQSFIKGFRIARLARERASALGNISLAAVSCEWLKIKCVQSEGFAIIGYEPPREALGGIGRLLLGAMKDGALVYVGGVGTDFTSASGTTLRKQMSKPVTDKPAATRTGKEAVWISPELVAEVAFRAWTDDGKLRHASFKGLRDEADAGAIHELPWCNNLSMSPQDRSAAFIGRREKSWPI